MNHSRFTLSHRKYQCLLFSIIFYWSYFPYNQAFSKTKIDNGIFLYKNFFAIWNIFYSFVAIIKKITMISAEILTNSLFDEFKPPFEASAFQDEILTADVQRAIFIAHRNGYQKSRELKEMCTLITSASITHDCTHYYLEQELTPLGFEFTSDSIGNSRAFFTKGDYIFILKKKDAPSNPTEVSKNLREQKVPKHVITISYETDVFRSNVTRVYVQYLQGKTIEYNFVITPEDIWNLHNDINNETLQEVVEHKKPRLKIKKQDTI